MTASSRFVSALITLSLASPLAWAETSSPPPAPEAAAPTPAATAATPAAEGGSPSASVQSTPSAPPVSDTASNTPPAAATTTPPTTPPTTSPATPPASPPATPPAEAVAPLTTAPAAPAAAASTTEPGAAAAPVPEAETLPLTPIWKPKPGLHWQWQMTGKLDKKAKHDLWVLDLFAYDAEDIKILHQAGRKVACSFSGGVYEPGRDLGVNVPASRLGEPNDERPGGRWLDIRQPGSKQWLQAQLRLAQSKGCDAVVPDHLYAYAQNSGFPITAAEQIDFNRWVADSAHQLRLSIGLHNDVEQIRQLEKKFDFALNEQCFTFNECDAYQPFLQAGKVVLGVEFDGEPADFCPQANAKGMDWLKKTLKLDGEKISCRK